MAARFPEIFEEETLKLAEKAVNKNSQNYPDVYECLEVVGRKQGPVSRKSRKLLGPEKPFVKLCLAYSVKLVFSYVVRGIKI